jgi:hypothetical protein
MRKSDTLHTGLKKCILLVLALRQNACLPDSCAGRIQRRTSTKVKLERRRNKIKNDLVKHSARKGLLNAHNAEESVPQQQTAVSSRT